MNEALEIGAIFVKGILGTHAFSFLREDARNLMEIDSLLFFPTQICKSRNQLTYMLQQIEDESICEITDSVELIWTFVRTGEMITLIGPYRNRNYTKPDCEQLLRELQQSHSLVDSFMLYCSTFPKINSDTVCAAGYAFVRSANRNHCDNIPIIHINAAEKINPNDYNTASENRPVIAYVQYTHDLEKRIMEEVALGNAPLAVSLMNEIDMRLAGTHYAKYGLVGLKTRSAIARTIVRMGAKNAGVPAPALDALSTQYNRKILEAENEAQVSRLQTEMIYEFCALTRQYRLKAYSPIVRKAVYKILSSLEQELSVATIAKAIGVSPNYLSSIFRSETGKTVTEYIHDVRMKKAANLLKSTTLSIQIISGEVGILDNNYFTKVFKSVYGKTPSEYRK